MPVNEVVSQSIRLHEAEIMARFIQGMYREIFTQLCTAQFAFSGISHYMKSFKLAPIVMISVRRLKRISVVILPQIMMIVSIIKSNKSEMLILGQSNKS